MKTRRGKIRVGKIAHNRPQIETLSEDDADAVFARGLMARDSGKRIPASLVHGTMGEPDKPSRYSLAVARALFNAGFVASGRTPREVAQIVEAAGRPLAPSPSRGVRKGRAA